MRPQHSSSNGVGLASHQEEEEVEVVEGRLERGESCVCAVGRRVCGGGVRGFFHNNIQERDSTTTAFELYTSLYSW